MKRKTAVRIVAIAIAAVLALSLLLLPMAAYGAEPAAEEDGITVLLSLDQPDRVLAENSVSFPAPDTMSTAEGDAGFGDLIADAYRYAALRTSAGSQAPATIAVVSQSVIRAALPAGTLTVEDAFRVLPGSGEEAGQGDPLIMMYLTGRELENVAEIDASFGSSDVAAALHFSGIVYTCNPGRIPMDCVTDLKLARADGQTAWTDGDALYCVVTDRASLQALIAARGSAHGFLKFVPKDAGGNEITDWDSAILRDETGAPVMAWQGLALYLASFAPDAEHIGAVPAAYAQSDGRKTVVHDNSVGAILENPGTTTVAVLVCIAVILVAAVLLTRRTVRRWSRAEGPDRLDQM